jgi:hypothetical protein
VKQLPLVQNCPVHPMIPLRRCYEFGVALVEAIRCYDGLDRVALGVVALPSGQRDHLPACDHRSALVTVIVTKTPRNEPDMVGRVETARRRRPRSEWVCATGRDGLGRRSACS